MACKMAYEFEVPVKQPASKVWSAFVKDAHRTLPSSLPECYSSIEYPEGGSCWCENGSVRLVKCVDGCCINNYTKEKLEEVDHENYFAKWTLTEGGPLGKYAREQTNTMKILPGADGQSCIVRFTMDYDSIAGERNFQEDYKQEIVRAILSFEPYLSANPDYSCGCN